MKADIGDLIYIPSEVVLFKKDDSEKNVVEEWKKIKKPANLLITSLKKGAYEVYYESEYWLVDEKQVYKT